MCIVSRLEIKALQPILTNNSISQPSDPISEIVKDIFQKIVDIQYTSHRFWDNGTTLLYRTYLTEKLKTLVNEKGFDVDKFKLTEVEVYKNITEQTIGLANRVQSRLDSVKTKYQDHPHYQMVMRFLQKNHNAIKMLLEKNSDGKEITKENLKAFKDELLKLAKAQHKTLYRKSPLVALDCINNLIDTSIPVSEIDEFVAKLSDAIELATLTLLVRRDRKNRISKTGGTCMGDSLLIATPLYQIGMELSGSFIQFAYSLHNILGGFYDPHRIETGKVIFNNPPTAFPQLREDACIVLNCQQSELVTLNPTVVHGVLGKLAAMARWGNFTGKYDEKELENIRYVLNETKSKEEEKKDSERQKKFGYWIYQHKNSFPNTWNEYSFLFTSYLDIGIHTEKLLRSFFSPKINPEEKLKLKSLYQQVNQNQIPVTILKNIHLGEFTYHEIDEHIASLPSCIRNYSKSPNRYILVLHSGKSSHAILLSLGETFAFLDPNFYNPVTIFPEAVVYDDLENFLNGFVKYLSAFYRDNNYSKFSLLSVEVLDETKSPEIKLRKWISQNNAWIHKRNVFIEKLDERIRRLIVDRSLTPQERDKLKSEVENGRRKLEQNGASLILFHDELKELLVQRLKSYETKLKLHTVAHANPKRLRSYQKVIDSYASYISQLCVNPQALVRYEEQT